MSADLPARAPTDFEQGVRNLARRLPYNWLSKKLASVLLRFAGGGRPSDQRSAVLSAIGVAPTLRPPAGAIDVRVGFS